MYPDELLYDFHATNLAKELGIENVGTPKFELYDDSLDTTSYRFATKPTSGTVYIKVDTSKM